MLIQNVQLDRPDQPANNDPAPLGTTQNPNAINQLHVFQSPPDLATGEPPIELFDPYPDATAPEGSAGLDPAEGILSAVTQDPGPSRLYYKTISALEVQPLAPTDLLERIVSGINVRDVASVVEQRVLLSSLLSGQDLTDVLAALGAVSDETITVNHGTPDCLAYDRIFQKNSYGLTAAGLTVNVFINGVFVPHLAPLGFLDDSGDLEDRTDPKNPLVLNAPAKHVIIPITPSASIFWLLIYPDCLDSAQPNQPISFALENALSVTHRVYKTLYTEVTYTEHTDTLSVWTADPKVGYYVRISAPPPPEPSVLYANWSLSSCVPYGWYWKLTRGDPGIYFARPGTAGINTYAHHPTLLSLHDTVTVEFTLMRS